ncbi:MAG: Ycf66 family protein [Cyanobacteriota bacterium]|nr:Ycf66 family protein [Cyanobacteriota bacterium]
MVNASLNWASIVGIVLAVGGALLYFMRSFKPALARDYDVFFAAVGLLCGGILFFQGWRLDPILQFGQFLLAGTTVFFAYESVRLRGVTTEQARRSSFFEDEELDRPSRPRMGGGAWSEDRDRFEEPQPIRRRIRSRPEESESDDFYRPRAPASRAAIPERAASRRRPPDDWDRGPEPTERGTGEPSGRERDSDPRRYSSAGRTAASEFGARRRDREAANEPRRGRRPPAGAQEAMPRSSRRSSMAAADLSSPGVPKGAPIRSSRPPAPDVSDADFSAVSPESPRASGTADSPTRDNSSRFDD